MPTRMVKLGKLERSFTLDRKHIDEDKRTVKLAFSSETPVERWFGTEILSHDPAHVRLGRMKSGGALLVDHNPRDHVGTTEDISIDSDKMGRATIRFGRSNRANEIFNDVLDGIRVNVSVGYAIHKIEEDLDTGEQRAVDWEPYEISLVSTPADMNVGIGRSSDFEIETTIVTGDRAMSTTDIETVPAAPAPAAPAPAAPTAAERKALKAEVRTTELARAKEIRALGAEHNLSDMAETAIESGDTIDQMRGNVLDHLRDSAPATPTAPVTELGLTGGETQSYSILRALQAQNSGDWKDAEFERECSDEISLRLKREPNGFFIPYEIQNRALNVGTDTAGGYLVNEDPRGLIEYLYANTVIGQAGATYLPGLVGDVPLPKLTGKSAFYWLNEDEDGTDSEPTLGVVTLMPRTVAGAVPMTRKLLKQSTPSIEQLVMNDLNRGVALAIDVAALSGSGVDGQPLGIMNTTGISTQTIATPGSPTWVETVGFETKIESSNAVNGSLSWVTTPGVKGSMKTTAKDAGSGVFIMNDAMQANGYNLQTTTQMAANGVLFGDFSSLMIGMWGVMDVVADTSTKVKSGGLVLRVFQDLDVGVRHIESFCKNA